MSNPVEVARMAWGPEVPDWVLALAQACAGTSQNRVARELDRSPSLVSNVLRGKYAGDMAAVEERVRGVYMSAIVSCPVLGDLSTDQCQLWRARAREFYGFNSHRVHMRKACKACPIYQREQDKP